MLAGACFCGWEVTSPVCPNPDCDAPPLSLGTPEEHAESRAMRRQAKALRDLETEKPPPLLGGHE